VNISRYRCGGLHRQVFALKSSFRDGMYRHLALDRLDRKAIAPPYPPSAVFCQVDLAIAPALEAVYQSVHRLTR